MAFSSNPYFDAGGGAENLSHELANKIRDITLSYGTDLTKDQYRMIVETAFALVVQNHFGGLFLTEENANWEEFLTDGLSRMLYIIQNLPAPGEE